MKPTLIKQLCAEAIGTYCLVFAGTGAIVINDVCGGEITHVGIALTFGLIVLAMIYAIGDVSGAHINPAVTIGFAAAGRFPAQSVIPYMTCQCAGALLASMSLRFMFPEHQTLGGTVPAFGESQSFVLEFILTFILMFVIMGVSIGSKEKGITAGLAVGSVVGLEALFAGPISGASMNPARSLGPAVATMNLSSLWLYVLAPVMGAVAAVLASWCVMDLSDSVEEDPGSKLKSD